MTQPQPSFGMRDPVSSRRWPRWLLSRAFWSRGTVAWFSLWAVVQLFGLGIMVGTDHRLWPTTEHPERDGAGWIYFSEAPGVLLEPGFLINAMIAQPVLSEYIPHAQLNEKEASIYSVPVILLCNLVWLVPVVSIRRANMQTRGKPDQAV